MSINRDVDIKEKKLMNTESVGKDKREQGRQEIKNNKIIPKLAIPEYQINISKINCKEGILNNKKIEKNEKSYKDNNYLKVKGGKEIISGSNELEKHDSLLETEVEKTKGELLNKFNEEKMIPTMNNLDKFNLGSKKNNRGNSRNNKNTSLSKNFKSDENKDLEEQHVLILNNNRFDYNSNSNNKLDINFDNDNLKKKITNNNLKPDTIADFKTIEIDKYYDRLKDIERNKLNNNSNANKKKRHLEKSNLKEKAFSKEKNEIRESNTIRVNFRANSSSKFNSELSNYKEFKAKKTLLSIDIFKSKGDANVIDRKFKKDEKKIVTNKFMSKESELIAAEKIKILSNNNYFSKLSPIKTHKKDKNEINKQTDFILLKSEKEDKRKIVFLLLQ